MSIEEKQNSPTYQDSETIEYPQNEREVSNFIKTETSFSFLGYSVESKSWDVGKFCFSSMDMNSPFFSTLS